MFTVTFVTPLVAQPLYGSSELIYSPYLLGTSPVAGRSFFSNTCSEMNG